MLWGVCVCILKGEGEKKRTVVRDQSRLLLECSSMGVALAAGEGATLCDPFPAGREQKKGCSESPV